MTEIELKACPGGSVRCNPVPSSYEIDARMGLALHRVECVCGWRGPERDNEAEAIDAWNTRYDHAAEVVERLEKLEREMADLDEAIASLHALSTRPEPPLHGYAEGVKAAAKAAAKDALERALTPKEPRP